MTDYEQEVMPRPFEAQLQIDRDNKRKVSLADGAM